MLMASVVAGCAAAVARLRSGSTLATLLLGIFMSMPLPGAIGQLALCRACSSCPAWR